MSSERERLWRLENPFRRRDVSVVELSSAVPALPEGCSNCGDTAGHTKKLEHRGKLLLVPYCTRCFLGVEREDTLRFAAVLSSVVLAVTLLVTAPKLWHTLGAWGYAAVVALGALLPVVVGLAVRRRLREGQSTSGRAVWWWGTEHVACTSGDWAKRLAEKNAAQVTPQSAKEPFPWPLLSAPVLGVLIAPLLFVFQHPEVVVLNLGQEPIVFVADGKRVATIPVTSLESPTAGVHLRLAAGSHRIELQNEAGQRLEQTEIALSPGRTHLFAPLSSEHCFWLERDAYGKEKPPEERYRALPEDTRFWTLPRDIDTWFAKNPDPSSDHRSSGGTLVALRHARCAEAPSELQ